MTYLDSLRKSLLPRSADCFPASVDRKVASVWGLLLLIAISIAAIEFYTLTFLKSSLIANPQLNRFNITSWALILQLSSSIRLADILLILLLPTSLVILIVGEVKGELLSIFFNWCLTAKIRLFCLLFLLWTIATLYYWAPGYILAADSTSHLSRTNFVAESFKGFHFPFWSNFWYLASPFLQFYGPLYFWITGLVTMIFTDVTLATKFSLWILHILSGFTMFLYVKQISENSRAAFLSSTIYVYAFAHTHLIIWKGALPMSLILALLPLTFYFLEKYLQESHPKRFLGFFTLTNALLLVSHPVMGLYCGWYLLLYIWIYFSLNFNRKYRLIPLLLSGVWTFIMSSFIIVPMLFEKSLVTASERSPLPIIKIPTLYTIKNALIWGNSLTGKGTDNIAYLGITVFVLAFLAIIYFLRKRERVILFPTIAFVFSFFISASSVREIVFILFFISILAGFGILAFDTIIDEIRSWFGQTLIKIGNPQKITMTIILLGLILIDIGPTTIQSVYRSDKGFFIEMGKKLESLNNSHRVIEASYEGEKLDAYIGPGGTPLMYFFIPLVIGPHNSTAPWTHNYAILLIERAISELNHNGLLSDSTVKGLVILNVKYILINNRSGYVLPDLQEASSYYTNRTLPAIEIADSEFILFSDRISTTYELSETLEKRLIWKEELASESSEKNTWIQQIFKLIDDMNIDSRRRTTGQIFVKDNRGYLSGSNRVENLEIKIANLSYELKEVKLDVEVNVAGFLQLSYPYYRFLNIMVDGKTVEPLRSALELVVLPMEAGKHNIRITAYLSPLRKGTLVCSIFGGGSLVVFLIWAQSRREEGSEHRAEGSGSRYSV